MKHHSAYLDWFGSVEKAKYDFRSSGLARLSYRLNLGDVDLSINYSRGNPETAKLLAQRYAVKPENIFISSEGASGQNARIIRILAERNVKKNEAIVEFPTYEPLLRQVQEHYPKVKRLERKPQESYRLDADELRKTVSRDTGLLVLTNPHAPSSAISGYDELKAICDVAEDFEFFVLSDEIYAEFSRDSMPTVFSVDQKHGIVTTSFTKAYGLGGLKLGTALADEELVREIYLDVLYTVGNSSNLVQLIATELLEKGKESLEKHKKKWVRLKRETEEFLKQKGLDYFPNIVSVTYWVELPIDDTYKWINNHALPAYGLALVPGAFFLFKDGYNLAKSRMIRIGLGNVNPDGSDLTEALDVLERALKTWHT